MAVKGFIRNKIPSQNPLSKSFFNIFLCDFKLYIFLRKRLYNSSVIKALKLTIIGKK